MQLEWTPWALPGMAGTAVAWSAAVVLLRTAPSRPLNRRLAAVLFAEGLWQAGFLLYLSEDPRVAMGFSAVAVGAMASIPFLYLAFLAVALDTPLVRPFRSRTSLVLLVLAALGTGGAVILYPHTFIGDIYRPPWAASNFVFRAPGARLAQVHGLASLFGLVASFHAFLRAGRGTHARSRAGWFAIAFGVRDLFNALLWTLYPVLRPIPFWGDLLANQGGAYISVLYVALMAYAVLQAQLFDLDLKIKFALERGTVGAAIAGGFFVGSEILESVIPVRGTILGLLSAAVIVVLLRPVQRFAEALAGRLMRGVEDSPDYRHSRKQAVYRAALEGAMEDGEITDRERSILRRLQEQLDLTAETAGRLEREVGRAIPG